MSEFLDKLESKLYAIDEKERKKVIKKYRRLIEEQIKEGKEEEEVIKSYGDIDDLAEEICSDYHVNLISHKTPLKKKINDGIEESAKFLAETTKDVIKYSKEFTTDKFLVSFFEILLKILVLIILFSLFKIPFIVLQIGADFVFELLFFPFNAILLEVFDYIIAIAYGICCIAVSIYMFKGYYIENKEPKQDVIDDNEVKKETVSKRGINYTTLIVKAILILVVVVPLIALTVTFLGLTALAIFLVFKEVPVIGLSVLLLSFFLLSLNLVVYVTDLLDKRERNYLFVLCISILSFIIGSVLLVDDLLNYNYPKNLEESKFATVTETINLEINKDTEFDFIGSEAEYIIDNDLKDNQVIVEVTYYDDIVDIVIDEMNDDDYKIIYFYAQSDDYNFGDYRFIYETIIDDLKENNIYDYSELYKFGVKVYCNETTKELVK